MSYEKGFAESKEHLAAIVSSSADAIVSQTPDGIITSWNKAAERIFGYSAAEMIGQSILVLFPPERRHEERELAAKILSGVTIAHFETVRLHKDGRPIDIAQSLAPIFFEGKIAGISKIKRDVTVQKKMQAALMASEQRHRTTLDGMLEGCQILSHNWEYLYLNKAAEIHNRRSNKELLGRKMPECWPGIDQTHVFKMFKRTLEERISLHEEVEFTFPDGHQGWFEARSSPVPDGIFILSIDITERKLHELELARQQRLYTALSHINQAIVRLNDRNELFERVARVLVTDAGLKMCWIGWRNNTTEKIIPVCVYGDTTNYVENLNISVSHEDASGAGPTAQALRSGIPRICNDMLNEPGLAQWRSGIIAAGFAASAAFPIGCEEGVGAINVYSEQKDFFKDKEIALLREAAEDVSFALANFAREKNKKRLEAVAEREGRFAEATMASIPGIIYFYNMQGKFLRWSSSFAEVSGYNDAELAQMHPLDFFEGDDKMRVKARIDQVFKEGSGEVEAEFTAKSGKKIPYFFTGRRIFFEGEVCLIGTGIDISKIKEAEREIRLLNQELERRVEARTKELEAANKELEAFSYSVSHDLRSPLRAINGFAEIVLGKFSQNLSQDAILYLERIRRGGQRMGELIDDLLAFSRLSRMQLSRMKINTNDLVAAALEELVPQITGRNIDLHKGDLPECFGDKNLLKQVWLNLLSNAVKYTRDRNPAVIEIGATVENGEIVFFVKDNGAGFDMQYVHKLFGVFQRLHRIDEFEGTGVGLAIVQRVIHRHGGRVWADARENDGATFRFTLPAIRQNM